jgi:lipopolysaccharide transport system ATP-binding protein
VFGTNTHHLGQPTGVCAAGEELSAAFTVDLNLGHGTYSISAALHHGRDHLHGNYDWWDHALAFEVISSGAFAFVGVAALPTRVTMNAIDGATTHDGP